MISPLGRSGGILPYRRASRRCAVLSFADLDEVLFDIDGLIEAQSVIQRVTKLPFFTAWNGKRVDP